MASAVTINKLSKPLTNNNLPRPRTNHEFVIPGSLPPKHNAPPHSESPLLYICVWTTPPSHSGNQTTMVANRSTAEPFPLVPFGMMVLLVTYGLCSKFLLHLHMKTSEHMAYTTSRTIILKVKIMGEISLWCRCHLLSWSRFWNVTVGFLHDSCREEAIWEGLGSIVLWWRQSGNGDLSRLWQLIYSDSFRHFWLYVEKKND